MTPEQALQFFRTWTMEVMPVKHLDAFNQAFAVLSKLIEAAALEAAAQKAIVESKPA